MHPPIDYTDEFVDQHLRDCQLEPEPDGWDYVPLAPPSQLGPRRPRKLTTKPAADQPPKKAA